MSHYERTILKAGAPDSRTTDIVKHSWPEGAISRSMTTSSSSVTPRRFLASVAAPREDCESAGSAMAQLRVVQRHHPAYLGGDLRFLPRRLEGHFGGSVHDFRREPRGCQQALVRKIGILRLQGLGQTPRHQVARFDPYGVQQRHAPHPAHVPDATPATAAK